MEALIKAILTPEILVPLLTLVTALLIKKGVLKAQDVESAKTMIESGATVSKITDATRMVVPEVQKLKESIKTPDGVLQDTKKKKISRLLRSFAQGVLLK